MKTLKKILLAVSVVLMLTALLSFAVSAATPKKGTLGSRDGVVTSYRLDADGNLFLSNNQSGPALQGNDGIDLSSNGTAIWAEEGWADEITAVHLDSTITALWGGVLRDLGVNCTTIYITPSLTTLSYDSYAPFTNSKYIKNILVTGENYTKHLEKLKIPETDGIYDFKFVKKINMYNLSNFAQEVTADISILLGFDTEIKLDSFMNGYSDKTKLSFFVVGNTPAETTLKSTDFADQISYYTFNGLLQSSPNYNSFSYDGKTGVLTISGVSGTICNIGTYPTETGYKTAIPWHKEIGYSLIREIDLSGWSGGNFADFIFYDLPNLEKVTLPNKSVKFDKQQIFGNCPKLKYVLVDGVQYTPDELATGLFDLRNATEIGKWAFSKASSIVDGEIVIMLGDGLTSTLNAQFMQYRNNNGRPITFMVKKGSTAETYANNVMRGADGTRPTVCNIVYVVPLIDSMSVTGFSIREESYNGLRCEYAIDLNVVAENSANGYELLGYGALAVATDNYDPNNFGVSIDTETGAVSATGTKVAVQPIWNGVTSQWEGKLLSNDGNTVKYSFIIKNIKEENYSSDIYFCSYAAYLKDGKVSVTYTDGRALAKYLKDVSLYEITLETFKAGIINSAGEDGEAIVWDVLKSGAAVLRSGTDYEIEANTTDLEGNAFGDTFTALEIPAMNVVKDGDTAVKFASTGATWSLLVDENDNNNYVLVYRLIEDAESAYTQQRVIWNSPTGSENQFDKNWLAKITLTVPAARPNPKFTNVFTKVTAIVLDDGITGVAQGSFAYMMKVKSVVYPETCKTIYNEAFFYCQALKMVHKVGTTVASGTADLSYVPTVSYNDYMFGSSGITNTILPETEEPAA